MSSGKPSPSPPSEVVDKGEQKSSPTKDSNDATGRLLKRVREGSLEPNTPETSVPLSSVTKKNRVAASTSRTGGPDNQEAVEEDDTAGPNETEDETGQKTEGKTVGEVREKVEKMNWKEGRPVPKGDEVIQEDSKEGDSDGVGKANGEVTGDVGEASVQDPSPSSATPAGDESWEKIEKEEVESTSGEGLKRKALQRSESSSVQLDEDSSVKRQKDTPSPTPADEKPVAVPAKKAQATFASFASSASPFASLKSSSPAASEATQPAPAPPAPVKKPQATFGSFASASSPFASAKTTSLATSVSESSQKSDAAPPPKKPQATFGSFVSSSSPFSAAPKSTSAFSAPPLKGSAFGNYSATSSAFTSKKTTPVEGQDKSEAGPSSFGDILKDAGGEEVAEKKIEMHEQDVTTGEEDEETVYQTRAKLYISDKDAGWKERGVGILKLNVRRSDGLGARLVMRADGVFRLLLNSKLYKGLNPMVDGKVVRMNLPHEGNFTLVSLRVGNPKVSEELADCIHEHIPLDGAGASKSPEPIGA
ncbi:hypothetical protein CI109_106206 [Kwoniella shandongensis]|uniref:Uncharacterized protein n=1 Tax=Kwoniella shandongensis TaxID=1734106 RepID=A0A5M6BYA2_9TREE|nr:uncharacterized protein CI109_003810 [Kwoniella shandongensis]KAA5527838.1 hypothetical protein CI109_003810 [Kwoniella shandongensis]